MKTHCLGNYSLRVALASATPQRSRVLLPTISTQSQLHPRLQHHYVRNATRRPRSFPRASSIRLPSQLRAVQLVIPRRQASTTAVTANATSPPPSTADPTPLTWNEFFGLRQRRRYFNVTSSLILSGGSFASGAGFVSQQSPETMQFFGMDPLVGMIAASLGFFGAGWLAGPLVGNTMFRLFYRKSGGMGIVSHRSTQTLAQ